MWTPGCEGASNPLRDLPRWTESPQVAVRFAGRVEASVSTVWVGRRFDYQVSVPARNAVGLTR